MENFDLGNPDAPVAPVGGRRKSAKKTTTKKPAKKGGDFALTPIASVAALIAATKAIKDAREKAMAKGHVASDPRPLLRRRPGIYNKGRTYGGFADINEGFYGSATGAAAGATAPPPPAPKPAPAPPAPPAPPAKPQVGGRRRGRPCKRGGAEVEAFNDSIANEQFGNVSSAFQSATKLFTGGSDVAKQFGGEQEGGRRRRRGRPCSKKGGNGEEDFAPKEEFADDVPQEGGRRRAKAKGKGKKHGGALEALQAQINNFIQQNR